MKQLFRKTSSLVSNWAGTPGAFLLALFVVITWASTGPIFHYSNTWQLIINTGTTIGTFLMVFLIQNTQNRDGKAVQLKLDELIRVSRANDGFIDLEDMSDEDIREIDEQFRELHARQESTPAMHKLHKKLLAMNARQKKP